MENIIDLTDREKQKCLNEIIDLNLMKVLLKGYSTLIDLKFRFKSLTYSEINLSLTRIKKSNILNYQLKSFSLAGHKHYSIEE